MKYANTRGCLKDVSTLSYLHASGMRQPAETWQHCPHYSSCLEFTEAGPLPQYVRFHQVINMLVWLSICSNEELRSAVQFL